jgi:hypothetical protein
MRRMLLSCVIHKRVETKRSSLFLDLHRCVPLLSNVHLQAYLTPPWLQDGVIRDAGFPYF